MSILRYYNFNKYNFKNKYGELFRILRIGNHNESKTNTLFSFVKEEVFSAHPRLEDKLVSWQASSALIFALVEEMRMEGRFADVRATNEKIAEEALRLINNCSDDLINPEDAFKDDLLFLYQKYIESIDELQLIDKTHFVGVYSKLLRNKAYVESLLSRYDGIEIFSAESLTRVGIELIKLFLSKEKTVSASFNTTACISPDRVMRMDALINIFEELGLEKEYIHNQSDTRPKIKEVEGFKLRNEMISAIVECIVDLHKENPNATVAVVSTFADESMMALLQEGLKANNIALSYQNRMKTNLNKDIRSVTALSQYAGSNQLAVDVDGLREAVRMFLQVGNEEALNKLNSLLRQRVHLRQLGDGKEDDLFFLLRYIANAYDQGEEMSVFFKTTEESIEKVFGEMSTDRRQAQVGQFLRFAEELDIIFKNKSFIDRLDVLFREIRGRTRLTDSLSMDSSVCLLNPFSLFKDERIFDYIIVSGSTSRNWGFNSSTTMFDLSHLKDIVLSTEWIGIPSNERYVSIALKRLAELIIDKTKKQIFIYKSEISAEGWKNTGDFDQILIGLSKEGRYGT